MHRTRALSGGLTVEAGNIGQFPRELGIVADLKRRYPVRLQIVFFSDTPHRSLAHALCPVHQASAPVRRITPIAPRLFTWQQAKIPSRSKAATDVFGDRARECG